MSKEKSEILQGFKEIAVELGYDAEEVYFDGEKLVLPKDLKEKVIQYSDRFNRAYNQ